MKRFLCLFMIVLMLVTLVSCQNGGYVEDSYLDEWVQSGEETYQETTQENTAYENDDSTQSSNKGNSTSGNNDSTQSSNKGNGTSGTNNSTQKVYKNGETWVLPGVWEITLNDVFMHYPCNYFSSYYGTDYPTIILDFTFKNIGYSHDDKMYLNSAQFEIYDATGTHINLEATGCIHAVEAPECIVGTKGHYQQGYVVSKDADLSKITISYYDWYTKDMKKATGVFESTVDKTDRFASSDEDKNPTNNEQTKEPTSDNTANEDVTTPEEDETLWTYEEANDLYSYIGNAKDYAKKALDQITKATSIANQAMKLSYITMAQSYISYAKKDLERARTIAENNSSVSYTDGTVLLDEINDAITQCNNIKDKSLTAEETENQTYPLYNDVSNAYQKTISLSMFANKILQEFTNT